MKLYNNPEKDTWKQITRRPLIETNDLEQRVEMILNEVRTKGDQALREFSLKFDRVEVDSLAVSAEELSSAKNAISDELTAAIKTAANNIRTFHTAQIRSEQIVETMPGVQCWRRSVAIENVGLYIPGGSAPLFSTLLMLVIPAQIAGCKNIFLCTPPDQSGKINPVILYVADFLGLKSVYKTGGAQAIAAMAYGTDSIPKADKIFGPGNQYVMKAKELVQKGGIAIDLPAGPSEVLVIADQSADPEFVVADLLSQAEHGPDSQVVLLTNDEGIQEKVQGFMKTQLERLPRKNIAAKAIEKSISVVFETLEQCLDFSNAYAPEHLILAIKDAEDYLSRVQNAGSVFLGDYSCESAGDYASGTNHTLPTNGYAKSYSGVSLDSFVKNITFQKLSQQGLQNLGKTIEVMAAAEQLEAHKNAVSIRLKKIQNEL